MSCLFLLCKSLNMYALAETVLFMNFEVLWGWSLWKKGLQITSLLLSHHHSTCALVSEILMSVLQTVQKQFKYRQYTQCTIRHTYSYQYTLYTVSTHSTLCTHTYIYIYIYIYIYTLGLWRYWILYYRGEAATNIAVWRLIARFFFLTWSHLCKCMVCCSCACRATAL